MIPFVCVETIDSPTFQSTTRFPTVAVPPVLLKTDGVMDCAVATFATKRIRKVKRRKDEEGKKGEEKVRSEKKFLIVIFIINYSITIAKLQNYQQKQIYVCSIYSV